MKKRSEQEWRDLFVQQATSELSANQFCKLNDLCPKHFSLRKKQLTQCEAPSAFVPITVNRSRVPDQTPPALVLRHSGSALYFDATPTPDWLAQLMRALA